MLLVEVGDDILYSSPLLSTIDDVVLSSISGKLLYEIFPATELLNLQEKTVIMDRVEDRSTADVKIWDETGVYHWSKGQPVSIKDSESLELLFSGYVETSTEQMLPGGGKAMYHTLAAADNHYLADKRIIMKAWEDTEVSEIVSFCVTSILTGEGISIGEIIPTSPERIITQGFSCSLNNLFDQCATFAGYTWFISSDKKFYFIPRTTYSAPFNIEKVGDNYPYVRNNTITVVSGNPEFRNYQYIRGGKETTDAQVEGDMGTGEKTTFTVAYDIAEKPGVTVSYNGGNYVTKTVGIRGVESGFDWYWSVGTNTISQDMLAVYKLQPPSTGYAGDKIRITYRGQYDIMACTLDYESVLDRIDVEGGGTGYVENICDDTTMKRSVDAIFKANAMLDKFAMVGDKISYTTHEKGLAAGQMQYITSPEHGLVNVECLITSVKTRDESGYTWYDITAINGPVDDYWTKVFLSLAKLGLNANVTSSSSVIIVPVNLSKVWTESESPNIFKNCTIKESPTPDTVGWPCFDQFYSPTYIQLGIAGGYRRYRTAQVRPGVDIREYAGTTGKEYTNGAMEYTLAGAEYTNDFEDFTRSLTAPYLTTYVIPSAGANGTIASVKIYGGSNATEVIDSGTLIDDFSGYYRVKNKLEILQFIISDTKWA